LNVDHPAERDAPAQVDPLSNGRRHLFHVVLAWSALGLDCSQLLLTARPRG
jgi:hypothetical protein